MKLAVVGHVEWVDFAVVARVPHRGEIVEARETFAAPGGGGAVAAVQLARLAGPETLFLTAVGDDELGERTVRELRDTYGVDAHAAVRPATPTRRAFTHLDDGHERTITVVGERLVPHGDDDLPWDRLADVDALYYTGGDSAALHAARAAGHVVVTPRAGAVLRDAGVQIDALVASANDAGERVAEGAMDPPPRWTVLTDGERGGSWTGADRSGRWAAAAPPGPPVDAYGAGDSFAAGLTYGLGAGLGLDQALDVAARAGAQCLAGRGPYGRRLEL